jgi:ABC-type phosphate transport system substrate-binding protein
MRAIHIFVTLAVLAGCGSPTSHSSLLEGNWRTAPIPSGGSIAMTLSTTGPSVSGTGSSTGIGPNPVILPLTITGFYTFNTYLLTINYQDGRSATYSGGFDGSDKLTGTWTESGQAGSTVEFVRQ